MKLWCCRRRDRRQATVHRTVVFDWFESDAKIKTPPDRVVFLFWQRMRDSNPRKRSQSPVCYRYTNPLSAERLYYILKFRKVKR